MNVFLWIVAGLLAAAFLAAGLGKLTQPKEKLAPVMPWTEDFSARAIRLIGTAEALGALGLILPAVTGIAPVLVPVAATGLAVAMAGAIATHVRRREAAAALPSAVLLVLAVVVAWGRFGPYAFGG